MWGLTPILTTVGSCGDSFHRPNGTNRWEGPFRVHLAVEHNFRARPLGSKAVGALAGLSGVGALLRCCLTDPRIRGSARRWRNWRSSPCDVAFGWLSLASSSFAVLGNGRQRRCTADRCPPRRGQPTLRVPAGSHRIEPQLNVGRGIEEHPKCAPVGAIWPGDSAAFQLGYVVAVDGGPAACLGGDEPCYCLGELALGHASRQAFNAEPVVDQWPLWYQWLPSRTFVT